MSEKLLITRPEHDDTTYYLSTWSKKIIKTAESKGIKIFDLNRGRANRAEVVSMLSKQNPGLVIFNGHGDDDVISGHANEPLIQVGDNELLLKNRIAYALSCKSAKILGPKSIDAGARSYVGYDDDFIFFYDPNKVTHPLEDDTAALFLAPSNELIISLIKGNNVGDAFDRSQNSFKNNIKRLLSSEATAEETNMARYIWWDMAHQACCGNKKAIF